MQWFIFLFVHFQLICVSFSDVFLSTLKLIIFAGVKNADENELRSIASEPDATHVYNVADFNIMSSIVEGLTKVVCEQVEQQEKDIKQSKRMKDEKETSELNF